MSTWTERYLDVRGETVRLAERLGEEDCQVQSMPDASPTKWHLAHTSWFFETFLLKSSLPGYRVFDPGFDYLFNSYYHTVGAMHPRERRGMLSRPRLADILAYRDWIDRCMVKHLSNGVDEGIQALLELGLNHEQQHQELILTDIKHLFSLNPSRPAYDDAPLRGTDEALPMEFIPFDGGVVEIGHGGGGFAFDNESPRHEVLLRPYALANRPVTNEEFGEFVRDGAYRDPRLWLSDGWAKLRHGERTHPLYWNDSLDAEFTLHGEVPLDPTTPASHVTHYEADAFARWAGMRLPTEVEWEVAAGKVSSDGHFLDGSRLHPRPSRGPGMQQIFGGVWEWTSSAYLGYPGFRAPGNGTGEYNGKFMSGQVILRGGSCVTPPGHIRATYRNYFPPDTAWQFTGIRLARDA